MTNKPFVIVHALSGGLPSCMFQREPPNKWPHNHGWASVEDFDDPDQIPRNLRCLGCVGELYRMGLLKSLGASSELLGVSESTNHATVTEDEK